MWKQAVPDVAEINDGVCEEDPLDEENLSPVPNLVHKYPDRVLFLVSNKCAMYCRFCTRNRKVGTEKMKITPKTLQAGYDYLRAHPGIREVLISGGDPLLLPDEQIAAILKNLRSIPSVEVIRIGTRVPSVLPMRITDNLVTLLKAYHPLYINTHFNHPDEITAESSLACTMLADAGIPLGCQTVLLKGVNDDAETLKKLFLALLRIRVKPYYLFQADLTRGTNHFRTSTATGIAIMRQLYGHISGMAIPTYALDGPKGKGKIPLTPQYILAQGDTLVFENYQGHVCMYPEAG
jgi:lysine 2,3-aminomutase